MAHGSAKGNGRRPLDFDSEEYLGRIVVECCFKRFKVFRDLGTRTANMPSIAGRNGPLQLLHSFDGGR